MTIELALCIVFGLAAYPLSKSIAVHYAAFAAVNIAMLGYQSFDTSLLALTFAILAVTDVALVIAGGRPVLLISAAVSLLLCLESMLNMDWLLSHSTYTNAAVNAVIAASMLKGFMNWTHGK